MPTSTLFVKAQPKPSSIVRTDLSATRSSRLQVPTTRGSAGSLFARALIDEYGSDRTPSSLRKL